MRSIRWCFRNRFTQAFCLVPTFISIIVILYVYKNLNGNPESSKSESWTQNLIYESKHPKIIGFQQQRSNNSSKKFLTIGIPTVYRAESYLKETLERFINESTAEERESVTIILYLGDLDPNRLNSQLSLITSNFQPYLASGFIQIIHPNHPNQIYPKLNSTTSSIDVIYNDSAQRVGWRSKQVLDFTFLLLYSASIKDPSDYFMVMEDDIEPSPGYITTIKDFINSRRNKNWIAIEFTEFLGIGLCFHTKMLNKLVDFLLLFYKDHPVDILMRQFIGLQIPSGKSVRLPRKIPSVFQHFGTKSTLKNKVQGVKDVSFEMSRRKFKNVNPPASLNTTMKIYKECSLQNAYSSKPGFFWGISSNETETIIIVFNSPPILVSRIVIFSGGQFADRPWLTRDAIENGFVQFSQEGATCSNFRKLGNFKDGQIDISSFVPVEMACLQIVVSTNTTENTWIAISEIEIFTGTDW